MAGFADGAENSILDLLFRAVAYANVADNAGTSPLTDIQFGLHTADPTDSGDQTSNEAAYGSYAREAVTRGAGFSAASGGSISPAANIDFTEATSGSETETHAHAGRASSSTGEIFMSGPISPNISVSTGVIPRLTTASTLTLD